MSHQSDVTKRLADIAYEISQGADPIEYQEEIDTLLGTSMEERDEIQESAWEDEYRNGEDE